MIGYAVIILTFGVVGSWSAYARLDRAVVAQGTVNIDGSRKTVQHLEGGIVKDIRVKEGQDVKKGELLFKIKPDNYVAARNSAQANYNSSVANRETSRANLEKADLEYKRNDALFQEKLISESDLLTAKTALLNLEATA